MTVHLPRGLRRLAVTLAAIGAIYAVLAVTGSDIEAFLHWFDWLSAAPGLSGLTLLILSPFVVLAALFTIHWVYTGFVDPPEGTDSPE